MWNEWNLESKGRSSPSKRPTKSFPQILEKKFRKSPIIISDSSSPSSDTGEGLSRNVQEEMHNSKEARWSVPQSLIPFRTCLLSRRDLNCLAPHKCLNDAVINSYVTLLSNKYNTRNQIGFTNSFFINKLKRDGWSSSQYWEGIGGERLDIYKKFLVPVDAGFHWILIEVDFETSSVNIYDSLGKRGRLLAKNVVCFMKRQGIRQDFVVRYPEVPKQGNSHDCGVYMLRFTNCIFKQIPVDSWQFGHKAAMAFREKLKKVLSAHVCAGDVVI
jgi:Ulp1 family protease